MITKMGMPIGGLSKAGFSGSQRGMRFFVKSFEEGKLTAYVFPEPKNFVNTPDDKKITKEFDFDDEARDKVIEWLNEIYEEKKEYWEEAYLNRNNAE